ncbi:cystathionine beta-lyase [Sphingobium sp. CCH11-B1]|jgi:cystathionine beta-lyase|uniref:cystathionine beta-lyase n=1 Tax=Sphingobium sp. CCH11-B1 TaxID=1768781 RepID=UPI00082B278B|nr:cystathionine beta-lyase [Sphingobium sp. CCH11-B1]MEA3389822.1 cystathionine beta-lyase [Pseudomonadota bacterium]
MHKVISDTTLLAHAGIDPEAHHGFVNPAVYRGSTVAFPSVDAMAQGTQRYRYGRWGNPTSDALCEALNTLESAEGTVLCPSGLAACTTAILAVCGSGDHLLVPDSVYGPVRHFCDTAGRRMGIETTYYDPLVGEGIADLIKPHTKAVFTESPGSHTFEIQDIPAIAAAAHARNALVLMDNSWATPLFLKPLALGVDISIMAATKYIVGHSDAMLGTIACGQRAWDKVRDMHFQLGQFVGPDDVALALRGLRTLDVRLARHQDNALAVARWLETQPDVARVLYPALPSHPGHDLWSRDFRGATGLLSFVTRAAPPEAVAAMIDGLDLFRIGYSWGGFESLVMTIDPRSLRSATTWEEPGQLVRLHIGLEKPDDLIADLSRGFARLNRAKEGT